ncbi:uncharacterized protein LACBIDRAFT_332840 [Laccaria bicolor S238N-H82]|uniref:Predicted protein n=1 Tax=Laccaria bicolor (strain S238N-H82 / ATCC MYA-4686) TaxID=486041 RepID=B0DU20_LACBS|nr:uncharacterized protein LACBIDRAFT_332840 [Laccaria bicolor S238N-H82]EDR01872.1 predicted protein [Laccaria bicolor S238N-H82]|eukprot:XP_001887482.1 predicted protein [Laccaria bicolor S238N-H82]
MFNHEKELDSQTVGAFIVTVTIQGPGIRNIFGVHLSEEIYFGSRSIHGVCKTNNLKVGEIYTINGYREVGDYQMDVELSNGLAIQIDTIPSLSSDSNWGKDFPYTPEESKKLKEQVFSCKRPHKSRQDSLDRLTLLHTQSEKIASSRHQAPTTRHRFIFSTWPRDPKGKPLLSENSMLGKMVANEVQHWGATLFDFYHVRRMHNFASREDYTKEELQLVEEEEDLKESFPCDIAKLVEDEPFDTTFNSLPILQQRLPLHLLPMTLYVHDQFRLLQVRDGHFKEHHPQPWSSKPDIVHAYSHNASPAGREKMEKEQEKLISDHEVEEALRKGAKPEEHSSALALYGQPHPWIN